MGDSKEQPPTGQAGHKMIPLHPASFKHQCFKCEGCGQHFQSHEVIEHRLREEVKRLRWIIATKLPQKADHE